VPGVPTQAKVELAAVTIPIIDFDWILGPLRVARKLTVGTGVSPNGLVSLDGDADTWWDAPIGPTGEVKTSLTLPVTLADTALMVDLGFEPDWKSAMTFSPLGAVGPTIDFNPELSPRRIPWRHGGIRLRHERHASAGRLTGRRHVTRDDVRGQRHPR
jgi:hypothetical protein